MYKWYCRSYQQGMRIAAHFLPWREPYLIEGENSLSQLPNLIKREGITHILIVTDKGIVSVGLMEHFLTLLDKLKIHYVIYDKTVPNPTVDNIEEALQLYKEHQCEGIVAFGGGSPIDCAKGVGARLARPHKTIPQMKGVLKVMKKIPPFFAVPTTAGTGSETTLATVVSNSETNEKYAIMDTSLIPHFAVLDPQLTVKLPPHITSTTGMDALTHAVEAYIGKSNTKDTKKWSMEAIQLIFDNLYEAYSNGENIIARKNMQKAAYLAGKAFTRAYVGYVHAISHQLGGFYHVPHGLANAVILPNVLEYYGESVYRPLAELSELVKISKPNDSIEKKAKTFIQAIREFNTKMKIPTKIEGILEKDIPTIVERALKEGNPLYPVPKILHKEDIQNIIEMIREKND